jgi:hypothetical protein
VRVSVLLIPLLLLASPALAVPGPPPGWSVAGKTPDDYLFGTDPAPGASGKQAAYIKARPEAATGSWGMLIQCIKPDNYIGQRLRFAARVKTVNASAAQLFMRVDGGPLVDGRPSRMLGFYNMMDRPVRGTTDWQNEDVVLDVPVGSLRICYGVTLNGGRGEAWADGLSLTKVGQEVPVSRFPPPPPPSATPTNLGFER